MTYFPGILSNGSLATGLAAGTVRTSLGLGTADSPTFAKLTTGQIDGLKTSGQANLTVDGSGIGVSDAIIRFTRNAVEHGSIASGGMFANRFRVGINNAEMSVDGIALRAAAYVAWGSSGNTPLDLYCYRGGPGILSQRNGTNGQISEIYKTFTSATSNERFCIDALSDAANHRLVVARGSLGGAERGLQIGAIQDGGSFVPWLSFATNGNPTLHVLPTSDPAVAGQVWRSGNDLKISTG